MWLVVGTLTVSLALLGFALPKLVRTEGWIPVLAFVGYTGVLIVLWGIVLTEFK